MPNEQTQAEPSEWAIEAEELIGVALTNNPFEDEQALRDAILNALKAAYEKGRIDAQRTQEDGK